MSVQPPQPRHVPDLRNGQAPAPTGDSEESGDSGNSDDAALVSRARAGDDAAYAALVQRYRDVALRTAHRITGQPDDAEDATQDAFVKAYYHLSDFRRGAPFRPWLLRIVANEAKNRRTAAARRAALLRRAGEDTATHSGQVSRNGHPSPHPHDVSAIPASGASPETAALEAERRRIVADALRELRAEDRTAIAYRYVHDLSEAEMAAALGVARGTVKSRLSRALTRLRAHALPALLAALILAIATGALALFPTARDAIAERLGLRGVSIVHVPALPGVPAPPDAPTSGASSGDATSAVGRRLGLGEPTTLSAARPRLRFSPLLPSLPALAQPDEVYADADPPGGRLTLLYYPRTDLPAAGTTGTTGTTGVGLLITQFRADLDPALAFGKLLGPDTRLEEVRVNGAHGYWIEGQPHILFFRDSAGSIRNETLRLAANTLLWEQGDLTLRLELAASREGALRIAASMAPSPR